MAFQSDAGSLCGIFVKSDKRARRHDDSLTVVALTGAVRVSKRSPDGVLLDYVGLERVRMNDGLDQRAKQVNALK